MTERFHLASAIAFLKRIEIFISKMSSFITIITAEEMRRPDLEGACLCGPFRRVSKLPEPSGNADWIGTPSPLVPE